MGLFRQRALAVAVVVLLVGMHAKAVVCLEACASVFAASSRGEPPAHERASGEAACHESAPADPIGDGLSADPTGWCGDHQNPLAAAAPALASPRDAQQVPVVAVTAALDVHAGAPRAALDRPLPRRLPPSPRSTSPVLRI